MALKPNFTKIYYSQKIIKLNSKYLNFQIFSKKGKQSNLIYLDQYQI